MTSEATSPPPGGHAASAALRAVARLLSLATGDIRTALLDEAKALLGASGAALIAIEEDRTVRDRAGRAFSLEGEPALAEALKHPALAVAAERSPRLAALLDPPVSTLLIVPLTGEVLLLGGRAFTASQVELAGAFGAAAAATLGHGRAAYEQARQVERQAALTRAARQDAPRGRSTSRRC